MGRYSKFLGVIYFTGDLLLLNFSLFFAYFLRFGHVSSLPHHYTWFWSVSNLVWVLLTTGVDFYEVKRVYRLEHITWKYTKTIFYHILIVILFTVIVKEAESFSRKFYLFHFTIFGAGLFVWRILMLFSLKLYRRHGYNYRNVVIVGAGPVGMQMYKYFTDDDTLGFRFIGFFDDKPEKVLCSGDLWLGSINDLKEYSKNNIVDEIYCALPLHATDKIQQLKSFANNNVIRFRIIPDFRGFLNKKVDMEFYDNIPVLTVRKEPLESIYNRASKRIFDIVFSFLVLLLIYPWLFPIIAILIKTSSKGSIFFKQLRTGRDNEEFYCYKFRTMVLNEHSDKLQAHKHDSRITKIGSILRKTSLDELPQFINVLIGNMSVVGPRPHMLKHTEEYAKLVDSFMVRHLVKPGITGIAQIRGYRGETKETYQMEGRVKFDVWYIENWSLYLDVKIVFFTVWNMIRGEDNAF